MGYRHRFCDEKKEEDRMAPRVSHSMIYHEAVGAVYIFGGRTAKDGTTDEDGAPRVYDEEYNSACFNDLWKLDLVGLFGTRRKIRFRRRWHSPGSASPPPPTPCQNAAPPWPSTT